MHHRGGDRVDNFFAAGVVPATPPGASWEVLRKLVNLTQVTHFLAVSEAVRAPQRGWQG